MISFSEMSEACVCTMWYAKSLYRRSIKQRLWFVNVRNFVSVHIIGPIVRMKNLSSMRKRTWDLIGYISQLQFIVIFVEIYWPFFMKFLNNAPILSVGKHKNTNIPKQICSIYNWHFHPAQLAPGVSAGGKLGVDVCKG